MFAGKTVCCHTWALWKMVSIYNNPSVNLATGVDYVDGRTDGRGLGGRCGRRRQARTDDVRRPAVGAGWGGGTARGLRRAAKPQSSIVRLWLVAFKRALQMSRFTLLYLLYINNVTLHWAQLVHRWVTACVHTLSLCHQLLRPTRQQMGNEQWPSGSALWLGR